MNNERELLMPSQIKHIRNSYSLSLRQFSILLGISPHYLSQLEHGTVKPSRKNNALLRLAYNDNLEMFKIAELSHNYICNKLGPNQYHRIIKNIATAS